MPRTMWNMVGNKPLRRCKAHLMPARLRGQLHLRAPGRDRCLRVRSQFELREGCCRVDARP
eukprot:5923202-Pleurochrysis_carterae.AAC.1